MGNSLTMSTKPENLQNPKLITCDNRATMQNVRKNVALKMRSK